MMNGNAMPLAASVSRWMFLQAERLLGWLQSMIAPLEIRLDDMEVILEMILESGGC